MNIIPYGRQYIDNQDIKFVSKALKQNLITTGSYVKKFENKISKFLKVKYVASCSSGTSALHLALMSINLKKNDAIIMPAINFIAVYNMARLMNAKIFLADVDPFTGQMTPKNLIDCIRKNKLEKIKAIITMYLGGYPENVVEFYRIKKKYKCYLIEDACHAFGARYKYNNKKLYIGSCKHSDLATFSFHPVKTLTTGEGGAVTTNNKILADKILLLRSHGIERKKQHWEYNVQNIGFNYRLSDINSALGISQLSKIKKFINFRHKIYKNYQKLLLNINKYIALPKYNKNNDPAFHLFLISLNNSKKYKKNFLLKFFKDNKILCQYHYIPIYKFQLFPDKINLRLYQGAEFYYKNTLSLPMFYNLNQALQKKILKKLNLFFN